MDYAHVTDGEIDAVGLPASGRLRDGSTVSGYDLLDHETLLAEGWLPIVDVRGEIADGQVWSEPTYQVDGDQVTATYMALDAPPDPAAELQAKLAALGAAMLADPDHFAELVSQVANSNTAKGPLAYLKAAIEAGAEAGA